MSYANGTQHYNLPQTQGSDKRDWFDTNEAFRNVDTDLYTAKQTAETTAGNLATTNENVTALTGRVTTAEGDVETLEGNLATTNENIGVVSQAVNGLTTTVANNKQDLKDSICAIEEDTATASIRHEIGTFFWYNDTLYKTTVVITIGSQIVPDVNCSTTNITTELLNGSTPEVLANVVRYDATNERFEYNNEGVWTVIPSGTVVAQDVGYTDTLTQLGASNVQSAIVALKTLIDNMEGGSGMYPDFKNKITALTLGPNADYTVPKDCYLYGRGICASGARTLKINGNPVAGCDNAGTTANLVSVPVQAGDVLSCEIALQTGSNTVTELALYELLS